ncbi:hypothetical protein ERO13_A07G144050v2 [Gossypium hirsutum]|nr:hypothetical protein ERO13_A07G144050v2 [Gossypium hirsutum]
MQTCWLDKNPSFLFMQVKFSGYSPTKICFAIVSKIHCTLFTFQPYNQKIKFKIYKREPFEQLDSLNYIQDNPTMTLSLNLYLTKLGK